MHEPVCVYAKICIAQELVGSFDKENDSSVIAVR